jgi:hypothetical protein
LVITLANFIKQSTQQKGEKKKEQRERAPKSEPELMKNFGYTKKYLLD